MITAGARPRAAPRRVPPVIVLAQFAGTSPWFAVNPLHGHAAGDPVIRQMRGRLCKVFYESDYLVRWAGKEFLIVARDACRRHADELAERARAAVADSPFELDDGALGRSPTVNLADAALYAIKYAGCNGWLGLLGCRSESAQAQRAAARGPLADRARSGGLDLTGSFGLQGWAARGDPVSV